MSANNLYPVTNVLVPGRAHLVLPDGSLALTESAVARVHTVVDYYNEHEAAFAEQAGICLFEGGWAKAAARMAKPPETLREGRLMRELALSLGLPGAYADEGLDSTTTMDNVLKARRLFLGVGNLAIVTQLSQADRFLYCASKALPHTNVTIIEAPGEDDPAIIAEEQRLLAQSRLLYGWARGPRLLHVADVLGTVAGRVAGLRPADKYGAMVA
jgi:hypothetical protein